MGKKSNEIIKKFLLKKPKNPLNKKKQNKKPI